MADNEGIAPVDPASPRGQVRMLVGDTKYTDTTPGMGAYNFFSDGEIDGFLTIGGQNIHRAAGWVMMQWANIAADEARIITDVDLKADLTKRYDALAAQAKTFFELADKFDSSFDIVRTGEHYHNRHMALDFLFPGSFVFPAGMADYPGEFYPGWEAASWDANGG